MHDLRVQGPKRNFGTSLGTWGAIYSLFYLVLFVYLYFFVVSPRTLLQHCLFGATSPDGVALQVVLNAPNSRDHGLSRKRRCYYWGHHLRTLRPKSQFTEDQQAPRTKTRSRSLGLRHPDEGDVFDQMLKAHRGGESKGRS